MSTNITAVVPMIDQNLQHRNLHIEGGIEYTCRTWTSTSHSNTTCNFTCPPPSNLVYIDRCVMFAMPAVITYGGTTTGSALLETGKDAPRCMPLHSVITNASAQINDRTFTIQPNIIIHPTSRYRKAKNWTMSPYMTDKYQNFVDGVLAANNPLGTYLDSVDPDMPLRGGFPMAIVNGATASTISLTIIEPVMIPPFVDEPESSLGFSNVNTMQFTFNFASSLSRMICHATSNATLSGAPSVVLGTPLLYMKYITPPPSYVPRPLSYGCQQITYFPTEVGTLTANSTTTITSTNVMLNCVPSHMYIYCRESDANISYTSSDTYCAITNISGTFANKTGILSSASQQDLFEISEQNGLQDNWAEFSGLVQSATLGTQIGTVGSVIRLNFAKNIPLNDLKVGSTGTFNMMWQVSVKNVNQSASIVAPTLYLLVVTPSTFTIAPGGSTDLTVGMTSEPGEYVPYADIKEYTGAGFSDFMSSVWSKIKSVVAPIHNFVKDNHLISGIASMIPHPIAQKIGSTASQLGYGMVGGMAIGGAIMNQSNLINRMRNI